MPSQHVQEIIIIISVIILLYAEVDQNKMLFLTNEPAKKAEINILTARDTTGPGY